MRRSRTRYLTMGGLLLIFAVVIGAYFAQDSSRSGVRIGRPAPEFAVPRLDGGTLALSEYRGRPVVINFLATWCGPCWRELPEFDFAAGEYQERGLAVVGLAVRDSRDSLERMVKLLGLTFPIGLDASGEVAAGRYQIPGLPATVFVDRQGVVRRVWAGPIDRDALDRAIGGIL